MPQRGIASVESAIERLSAWVVEHDYSIDNEAELCALAHRFVLDEFAHRKFPLAGVKSEVKLMTRNSAGRGAVKASIDFGLRIPGENGEPIVGHLEAKAWIRPDYEGAIAPNSSTSKRNQCVSDGQRLLRYASLLKSQFNGLLLYERGSTYLRRLVEKELSRSNVVCTSKWIDTHRPSLGRKAEHFGVVWLEQGVAA